MDTNSICIAVIAVILVALGMVTKNYLSLRKPKKIAEGEDLIRAMYDLSCTIRTGAKVFMVTEYKTIIPVVIVVGIGLSLFIEKTAGVTFLLGACMSSAACILGMSGALYANYRVARRALRARTVGRTVRTALKGGVISGLSVQAFGTLGLVLIFLIAGDIDLNAVSHGFLANLPCNPTLARFTTYSLGCSLVAMFNRVAGGNFTKAADISADIVAKIRHDLPEDDSRMPNTIADFIGDNVNDIAGNCSDLEESYVATNVSCFLIAGVVASNASAVSSELFAATCLYPIVLSGIGLLSCIIGLAYSLHHKNSDNPSRELNMATYISAALTVIGSAFAAKEMFSSLELYDSFRLNWGSPLVASLFGIASGVLVGKITEYYTGLNYRPVKEIAEIAPEGDAFVIMKGEALGSRSVLAPVLVIGISLIASYAVCGIYGIAVAALGMLSFVATTVSIDAFGPIADNAGGIAEGCHLPPEIREITDMLDAVGNTTAAIGKGFAIGSAAYATVSLIIAYVGTYTAGDLTLNIASPIVMVGAIIGGAIVEYFCAILTNNTVDSAHVLADAGDAQLTEAVLAGTERPDYEAIVELGTKQALRKMTMPSLLAMFIPLVGGFICGPEFVGGLLIGIVIVCITRAIYMGNSGGAWDNAKKYIEAGLLEGYGKGSLAHKAAVTGDTNGDNNKDVVGVDLDIFAKMVSTVGNTFVPLFAAFHLL